MSKASRLRKAGKNNDSETQASVEVATEAVDPATETVDPVEETVEVATEEVTDGTGPSE
jgi:hypothetical protein